MVNRFKRKLRLLHHSGLPEDTDDELECFCWVEDLLARDKPILVNHLHIKDVIDEAEKEINLADKDEDRFAHSFIQHLAEQALEDHEAGLEWGTKLVRESHLTEVERFILLLDSEELILELKSSHSACKIFEIDCCRRFVLKVYRFHSDSVILLC